MTIYFSLILLISFFSYFDLVKINQFNKKLMLFFIALILILFAGTRFETGNDWVGYTDTFELIPDFKELWNNWQALAWFRMEPGYVIFNSIIKSFGGTINDVFLISCFITITLLFATFKRYAIFPLITILLYMRYGYLQLNTMFVRQGIAIALFLFSLKYIVDKKLLKYILINLLGFFFHSSLLVALPLYFFVNKRFSNLFMVAAVFISVLLSFVDWIGYIVNFLPSFMQGAVIGYSESEVWGDMLGKINLAVIEKITIFCICIFCRKKLEKKNHLFNIMFNLFVLNLVAYYAFFQSYVFQQRITMVFQLSSIFLIPFLLLLLHNIRDKFIMLTLFIIIVIFFFMRYINMGSNLYIPYKSWLV